MSIPHMMLTMNKSEKLIAGIKAEMEIKGESQYSLAKNHGIDQAAMSRFLNGKGYHFYPVIEQMLDALKLDIEVVREVRDDDTTR